MDGHRRSSGSSSSSRHMDNEEEEDEDYEEDEDEEECEEEDEADVKRSSSASGGDDAAAATSSGEGDGKVTIRVQDEGEHFGYRLGKQCKLSDVFTRFAARKGLETSALRFVYDGRALEGTDTPMALEMEEGFVIDAELTRPHVATYLVKAFWPAARLRIPFKVTITPGRGVTMEEEAGRHMPLVKRERKTLLEAVGAYCSARGLDLEAHYLSMRGGSPIFGLESSLRGLLHGDFLIHEKRGSIRLGLVEYVRKRCHRTSVRRVTFHLLPSTPMGLVAQAFGDQRGLLDSAKYALVVRNQEFDLQDDGDDDSSEDSKKKRKCSSTGSYVRSRSRRKNRYRACEPGDTPMSLGLREGDEVLVLSGVARPLLRLTNEDAKKNILSFMRASTRSLLSKAEEEASGRRRVYARHLRRLRAWEATVPRTVVTQGISIAGLFGEHEVVMPRYAPLSEQQNPPNTTANALLAAAASIPGPPPAAASTSAAVDDDNDLESQHRLVVEGLGRNPASSPAPLSLTAPLVFSAHARRAEWYALLRSPTIALREYADYLDELFAGDHLSRVVYNNVIRVPKRKMIAFVQRLLEADFRHAQYTTEELPVKFTDDITRRISATAARMAFLSVPNPVAAHGLYNFVYLPLLELCAFKRHHMARLGVPDMERRRLPRSVRRLSANTTQPTTTTPQTPPPQAPLPAPLAA